MSWDSKLETPIPAYQEKLDNFNRTEQTMKSTIKRILENKERVEQLAPNPNNLCCLSSFTPILNSSGKMVNTTNKFKKNPF